MTPEQLRVFVAVAEMEHMTRAAQTLNMTQSTASAAISALESRHQVILFDRIGRGIALTEEGRAFLPEARAVLARLAQAEAMLLETRDLIQGHIRLIASQTIAGYWLPAKIAAFRKLYPGIMISRRRPVIQTLHCSFPEAAVGHIVQHFGWPEGG
ncbi:LysR family transcriptional regulator [Pseudorhodobacter turbinis]|uniref:LysR family transcriptional regulator n=1 Tax=Pseudorhodobacter turbinis TaxID=2500533 RepID=A0A4P8EE41_9RHOB|nr:LysR family transcriptional regulator [Pseudorhodobacter turbinis]QCO54665.1 LysR family transcriptional regulator [Pseudorhodobacter turbinis]